MTVAAVEKLQITASRGVKLVADKLIAECMDHTYDLIVLPGGIPGAENLRNSDPLELMLIRQQRSGRLYGAICASPAVVLKHHGLLGHRQATCHPDFVHQLENREAINTRVVVDGNCITSRGPGTALEFALKLVALLFDEAKAAEVAQPMLLAPHSDQNTH